MKIASTLLLAMAVASQAAQLDDGENLLFGRDALEEARAQIRAEDTYSGYFQPRSDIVFVRDYDAHTNEPLFTAAMIGDKKSQREAKRVKKSKGKFSKKSKSKHAERSLNMESAPVIFERASRCGQYCSNVRDCTLSPNCRRCVHANRVKPPPARNDHQKVCGP